MKRSARPSFLLAWLLTGAFLALAGPSVGQDEYPCEGLLEDAERLAQVLAEVPKYGSTYVLVLPEKLAEIDRLDAPALADAQVVLYADSQAVALAEEAGLDAETLPFELTSAGKIVENVLDGQLDAGLVWAPLAGLVALELDFDYALTLRSVGSPSAPPAAFSVAAAGEPSACAHEIENLLAGYGVVPAEKLVSLSIRELLHLVPPPRDLTVAQKGAPLYAEHCAKCHGVDAVAATDALAPVDIMVSVRRFSFPGFLYIVLNGRSQNGMPGFRGSLSREDVELIYQYARERSHGTLSPRPAGAVID